MAYREKWFDWGGSGARFFNIPIYGNKFYKETWFKWVVVKPWKITGNVFSDLPRWFKVRLNKTYMHHVIHTGLKPGWHDIDIIMLHGMFALLVRFVDWESGGVEKLDEFTKELIGNPDPNAPDGLGNGQITTQSEAVSLYKWWTVEYPADQKKLDELMHEGYGKQPVFEKVEGLPLYKYVPETPTPSRQQIRAEITALEKKIHDDEQNNLIRLVKIRGGLWT